MNRLEKILDDCLTRLITGEATLEDCLALYPEYADELHHLLAAASRLDSGKDARPTSAFRVRDRARLMAHMNANPRNQQANWWMMLSPIHLPFAFGRSLNLAVGLAAMVALFLTTGTVLAQSALPGDALYRWKIASEHVLRTVHPNPLTVDLMVAERRTHDLTQVDDPNARKLALQGYQETLTRLSSYTAREAKESISRALIEQKADLEQANLIIPELEQLLSSNAALAGLIIDYIPVAVEPGQITYRLTITNSGYLNVDEAALISQLAPEESLAEISDSNCILTDEHKLNCAMNSLSAGSSHHLTLTTAINPCYSGKIINTVMVTGANPKANASPVHQIAVETDITSPHTGPAQVVYVQSNHTSHSLGLVNSTADIINSELHARAAAPAWSPDGKRLSFFGEQGISELGVPYNRGNGIWIVEIVDGQAQSPEQLIAKDHIRNVAWSADGEKLAIEVGLPETSHEIVIIDANNGHELNHFHGEQPAWQPDSQSLVIKSCSPGCGLWKVSLEGEETEQITFDGTDSYPVWSPDGQYLAFSSLQRDGNWEIYLLYMANNEISRLTNRLGTDTTPVFDQCSREIYLRTDEYGSWWITALKLDGSDEFKIQEGVGPTTDWGLARPAVY